MNAPGPALNLIVVEDSELDYDLLLAMLMREGMRPRAVRVEDEAGMRAAFAAGSVDAVITDHNLPRFDSFASIAVAKSVDSDGTRPEAFSHQHCKQQLVVEFGVLDDDQAQCRRGRAHGRRALSRKSPMRS